MKTLLIFFLSITFLYSNNIKAAYAIGIFHENGKGENIQHVRITNDNYEGICFSKIVVFGQTSKKNIKVKIGNSIGHFIKEIPIFNSKKILIGNEITFKHYNITKGYFEVKINNKLYDTKVFIK